MQTVLPASKQQRLRPHALNIYTCSHAMEALKFKVGTLSFCICICFGSWPNRRPPDYLPRVSEQRIDA